MYRRHNRDPRRNARCCVRALSVLPRSFVEWPRRFCWAPKGFPLKWNPIVGHMKRLDGTNRLLPQDAQHVEAGFVAVAEVPEFQRRGADVEQFTVAVCSSGAPSGCSTQRLGQLFGVADNLNGT